MSLRWCDRPADAANSRTLRPCSLGAATSQELGINALELLPVADSFVEREWGYATSNYLAPDYDLGFPVGNASPTSNTDLVDTGHTPATTTASASSSTSSWPSAPTRPMENVELTPIPHRSRARPGRSGRPAVRRPGQRSTDSAASCGGTAACATATIR